MAANFTKMGEFQRDLAGLLNKYGIDNECQMYDWVLAEYMTHSINALLSVKQNYEKLDDATGRLQ